MKRSVNACLIACLSVVSTQSLSKDIESKSIRHFRDLPNESLALTPTRMGQLMSDIPGTVTVLEREFLLNQGIETIPEALRLVPGMSVIKVTAFSQASGHDYRIAYHGGSALIPRRMQVLMDGMSVYLAGLSKIDWSQLPVTVHDIERIEITRNPSAASYGANSFQAVVNIITRHSEDTPEHGVSIQAGTDNDYLALYRASTALGNTTALFRASTWNNTGYDKAESSRIGGSAALDSRDTTTVNRFNVRTDTLFNNKTELSIQVGRIVSSSESELVVTGQEPDVYPDIDTEDYYVNAQFIRNHNETSETKIRTYWKRNELTQNFRACSPAVFIFPESYAMVLSNPEYFQTLVTGQFPSGGSPEDDALASALLARIQAVGAASFSPVCGTLNQDYVDERKHITLEHHTYITPALRWLTGTTYEELKNTSETYFTGTAKTHVMSGFMSMEWKPSQPFTYNAGLMAEYSENIDTVVFSPRASINWHLKKNMTVRMVANRAYRTPDIAETDRNWNYQVRDISPVVDGLTEGTFAGNGRSQGFNLEPERIDATEIGLRYNNAHLAFDTRLFYEELDNLVSEKPAYSSFHLTNQGSGRVQGFETEASYSLSKYFNFNVGYSYQDHDFSALNEQGLTAQHSGTASLSLHFEQRTITFGYIGHSQQMNNTLDRWKASWREKLPIGHGTLECYAHLQYQPSDVVYAESEINLLNRYTYDQDTYAQFGVALSL